MTNDSAWTAAKLERWINERCTHWHSSGDADLTEYGKGAIKSARETRDVVLPVLASLRKQLDEAQRVQMTKADLRTVIELTRANVQMTVALRSVARWTTDEKLTTTERINIIAHQPQVRAASQEAPGHTDLMVAPESIDAFLEANPLPEEAPAAPAPEDGESEADYNRRCDDLILSIKAATPASHALAETEMLRALDRMASGDCEEVNPASPSPGLRDRLGVTQETLDFIESEKKRLGVNSVQDTVIVPRIPNAKMLLAGKFWASDSCDLARACWDAMLAAASHPVSEREGE